MPDRSVITFLPGFAQDPESLFSLAESVSDFGDCVLTSVSDIASSSRRRQGTDSAPGESAPICSDYAECFAALLDSRAQNTVIAWSMGAMIAVEAAKFFPELISRLVLLAGTARFVNSSGNEEPYAEGVNVSELRAMRRALKTSRRKCLTLFFKTGIQRRSF